MTRRVTGHRRRARVFEHLEDRRLLSIAPIASAAAAGDHAETPVMFDWLVRTYNASSPPPDGFACVPHPNHDGSNPLATSIINTYQYNHAHGLPVALMLRSDTAPLTGATESKRATLTTTMDWLSANGLPLDYVFSDFETPTRQEDLLEVVRQVRFYPDPRINTARVNDYPNYPGATDMSQIWQSSVDRSAADAFYRTSGQDVAMPNAYPYEYMEVHTRTSQWGTNVAPNKRSALFWAPLERVSVAKRALPEGHQLIPWMTHFVAWENYDAPEPTREDNVTLLRHVRLRGADGFYSLSNLKDKAYGWQDLDWLFDGSGKEILNLETDKTGGLQWSGVRIGDNVSLAISNLGNSGAVVDLPEIAGLPDASPELPAGTHYAADYVNNPAALDGAATITIGRDAIAHGLFVNGSVTLPNPIVVDPAGTETVNIGSDRPGACSPEFSGPLMLGRDVNLVSASTGTVTFSGPITGPGGVAITSAGSVVLDNAANDFAGPTTVAAGVLLVSGRTGSGPVTVEPGAELAGHGGLVGGALHLLAGAAVAPGPGPARLVAESGAALDSGATLRIELGGVAPGTSYDQLAVNGTVSLAGSILDVSLGYVPQLGDRITIIDNDATDPVAGTFAGLDEGAYFELDGHGFIISYVGGDGNDVVLSAAGPRNLDADGNGIADAFSDGILILRYLFDPAGQWEVDDAATPDAARATRPEIKAFLDATRSTILDLDGNGTADPLSDGILVMRYLLDPGGTWNVDDALGAGATRTTREEIKGYLDAFTPGVSLPSTIVDADRLRAAISLALVVGADGTEETAAGRHSAGAGDSIR